MKNLVLIILSILSISLFSQDFRATMKRLDSYYNGNKDYAYSIQFNYYNNDSCVNLLDKDEGVFINRHGVQYMDMFGDELFSSNDYTINISNTAQYMYLSSGVRSSRKMFLVSIDSILSNYNNIDFVKNKNEIVYTLIKPSANQGEIYKVVLVLNSSGSEYKRMLYFYKLESKSGSVFYINPCVEIVLSEFTEDLSKYKDKFSIDKYFVKAKDGNYVGVGIYKDYSIIDQLNKN